MIPSDNPFASGTSTSGIYRNMDVSLLSLGCSEVPVTGNLEASGTFVANADGTYADNTTTTGSATFPLAPDCLSISSVPVPPGFHLTTTRFHTRTRLPCVPAPPT